MLPKCIPTPLFLPYGERLKSILLGDLGGLPNDEFQLQITPEEIGVSNYAIRTLSCRLTRPEGALQGALQGRIRQRSY